MTELFILMLVALGAVAVGRWVLPRAGRAKRSEADRAVATIDAALTDASKQIADYQRALGEQRAETEAARRRADEYLGKIEGCVREATEAKSLYLRMTAEHGAAQAILLRQIESLAKQYRSLAAAYKAAAGKPPPKPEPQIEPLVERVVREFREEHPARLVQSDRGRVAVG